MQTSKSGRYIITVKFGKRRVHGLHIYDFNEAQDAKQRLVSVGAKPSKISIDTYESIYN